MAVKKVRLEVKPNSIQNASTLAQTTAPASPAQVISEKVGAVTLLDKLKSYYHTLIVVLGSILVIVNEVTPLLNFLPGNDKQYVTAAIAIVTAVATALKSNEHWVDDL